MGSFTNHRLIEKNTFDLLPPNQSLPGKDLFYKDIPRLNLSIDGVPCLSPGGKVLINGISKEDTEEDRAVNSSKALFNYISQKYNISFSNQPYYENFIKLFLNQLYIGLAVMPTGCLLYEKKLFDIDFCYNVEINLISNNLYLTVFHSGRERDKTNDLIFKSKTTFKIEVNTHNEGNIGFVAKFGLVDSTMDCNIKYKHILDTRNFLEKIIDFITSIFEKITTDVNSDTFLKSNPKLKSKPLFFVSEDGESMKNLSSESLSKELLVKFLK